MTQCEEVNELFRKKMADQGKQGKEAARASQQPQVFFEAVRGWLDNRYRNCVRTGTIEGMEISSADFPTRKGPCRWLSKQILTLDSCFNGVVLACTFIVAAPLEDGEAWPKQGAMLETTEMEGAKAYMTKIFLEMERNGINMDHAEIHIFMGADMVRGKWRPSTKGPTITRLQDKASDSFRKSNKGMTKLARRHPGEAMAMFLPGVFDELIKGMLSTAPGGTVWDEGELPFYVSSKPYPYATRVLVARDYSEMEQHVEATHYNVVTPDSDPHKDTLSRILRSAEPEEEPGGVVHVTLACALVPDTPWPLCGAFATKPEMKAAEAALIGLLKKWNREGRVQRCIAEVVMGADNIRFSFVGEKSDVPVPSEASPHCPR